MTFTPAPKKKGKPKNAKKKASHARAYGAKADWIRAQSCAVCGWPILIERPHEHRA